MSDDNDWYERMDGDDTIHGAALILGCVAMISILVAVGLATGVV